MPEGTRAERRRIARDMGFHRSASKRGRRPHFRSKGMEVIRPIQAKLPGLVRTNSGLLVVNERLHVVEKIEGAK